MSDKPCNRCTLRSMEATAEARGATVVVEPATGEMEGWTSARYSDRDSPSAWFKLLTEECAC